MNVILESVKRIADMAHHPKCKACGAPGELTKDGLCSWCVKFMDVVRAADKAE